MAPLDGLDSLFVLNLKTIKFVMCVPWHIYVSSSICTSMETRLTPKWCPTTPDTVEVLRTYCMGIQPKSPPRHSFKRNPCFAQYHPYRASKNPWMAVTAAAASPCQGRPRPTKSDTPSSIDKITSASARGGFHATGLKRGFNLAKIGCIQRIE